MCWRTCRRCVSANVEANLQVRLLEGGLKTALYKTALGAVMFAATASAQSVDPAALLKPPADSWLTYHGDYSGRHHSALRQITPDNVGQLALSWAFQTGQTQQIKATPIVANGRSEEHTSELQ